MYRNIREALASREREEGFTLIELLVVVIIIGILAAVAIPVFLNQREKAWNSAVKSDLRNAASAQESYFTSNNSYTATVAGLESEGFNKSADVTMGDADVVVTGNNYCMQASHQASATTTQWYLNSQTGAPQAGNPC